VDNLDATCPQSCRSSDEIIGKGFRPSRALKTLFEPSQRRVSSRETFNFAAVTTIASKGSTPGTTIRSIDPLPSFSARLIESFYSGAMAMPAKDLARRIIERLQNGGHQALLVGG